MNYGKLYFSKNKGNSGTEELESTGLREKKLNIQRKEHKYHRFVEGNLIIKSGLLDKKKVSLRCISIKHAVSVFKTEENVR